MFACEADGEKKKKRKEKKPQEIATAKESIIARLFSFKIMTAQYTVPLYINISYLCPKSACKLLSPLFFFAPTLIDIHHLFVVYLSLMNRGVNKSSRS